MTLSGTEINDRFGARHYGKFPLIITKARGVRLWSDSRTFLDCLSSYSATNQGHHHPAIVKAMSEALRGNYASVIPGIVLTDVYINFVSKLAQLVPRLAPWFEGDGNKILMKNGGVESVETALKVMRCYGWKMKDIPDGYQEIIVFRNNFHGRSTSVVAGSSTEKYREGFRALPGDHGFVFADFGNLESVRSAITPRTCGILVEPIQGEGGINIPPVGFLKGLRELADQNDLLLIFDEIQTGLGRTGKLFCFEHEGVIPDGLILGKALSGGLVPMSVFVTNSQIMDLVFEPGRDGSTYGGYPLACVAGMTALDVLLKENMIENARARGAILYRELIELAKKTSLIKEVRGRGLMIGVEMADGDAHSRCLKLLDESIFANDSHGKTIRISPPLIITDAHIETIIKGLKRVLLR